MEDAYVKLGRGSALRPSVPARHDEKPCTPACTVRPLWCFGVSRQQLGEMVQKSTILLWLLISQWCILYNLRLIWRRCALGNWHARRRIPRSVLACPLVVAKVGPFALVSWRRWVLGAAEPRI